MNLGEAFLASAVTHAERPAIFWGDSTVNYQELRKQALAVAFALQGDFGILAGDRVGLWMKNGPAFPPALFGLLIAGAVVVPINNFLKAEEVDFILGDAGIKVVITDENTTEGQKALSALRPSLRFAQVEALMAGAGGEPQVAAAEDLAVIIYTSGTTGRPKGAMLTHRNLLSNVASCGTALAAVNTDRFVVLLPMFHSFMLTVGVLLPLLSGGSLVVIRSVHPPKNIIHEVLQHRATILPAVPQFFRLLANAPVSREQLPLRICVSGGAPLPGEILREWTEKMPIPLIEGYGLSEASPVVSLNPIAGPWKTGSIGVPVPDVEVSIQDEAGEELSVGVTGEICVRGPNVMQGYWNQPDETAKALRNGWLLTGDIGHRDADGYFFITDRKKDMLIVNGINVYPREVEEAIYQFPGVREAAVIGVRDARKGEQPVAFVSLNEGVSLDLEALTRFLRTRLADYKVPRKVLTLDALPRNATGKILKTALRTRTEK